MTHKWRKHRLRDIYLVSRADRRNALKYLSLVRKMVADSGSLNLEKQKDTLTAFFGSQFYDELTSWAPQNPAVIHVAEFLAKQTETLNFPLPEEMQDRSVVPDPRQSWQMALKLIDEKANYLQDLSRLDGAEPGSTASMEAASLDGASRYFTSALRDLKRAIEFYFYLDEVGL